MTGLRGTPATPDRISATRRIAVPPHGIFVLVSDPGRHVDIDGSGMLRTAPDARPLTAVGQTFDIDMDRRPLGDTANTEALLDLVRDMPEYKVRCTVIQLIPDRLVEWTVRVVGKPPAGHVFGWQIEPDGDTTCIVTSYCDTSPPGGRASPPLPWMLDQCQRRTPDTVPLARRSSRPIAALDREPGAHRPAPRRRIACGRGVQTEDGVVVSARRT
jgi:hypothetical protein